MSQLLIEQLIDRKAIIEDISLEVKIKSMLQIIMITRIDEYKISGYDILNGFTYDEIPYDAIKLINGMEISRLAGLFNINLDGTMRKPVVRRGRKRIHFK